MIYIVTLIFDIQLTNGKYTCISRTEYPTAYTCVLMQIYIAVTLNRNMWCFLYIKTIYENYFDWLNVENKSQISS